MHGADVGVHLGDGLRRRLDDQVDPVPEHVEVEVGDQGGHLDQGVGGEVETGHLAVDPHESVAHERPPYRSGAAAEPTQVSLRRLSRRSASPPRLGRVKEWFGTLARLVVGGVWLVAGLLKVSDGAASVRAVRAYDLLPEAVVPTVGHALPALEIVIGLALIAGALTRAAAVASSLLLRGVHRRHRLRVGAWAADRVRLLRRRRLRRRRHRQVPRGDRPRRRPAPAVPLAGLATPHQAGARLLHLPSAHPHSRESDHVRTTRPTSTAERAAAALREQQAAERRRRFVIVGSVVAVLAIIGGLTWFAISRGDTTGEAVDESGVPGNTDGYAVVVGDADAPLTMKFYEDPQCPVCQQFEAAVGEPVAGRDRRRQGEGRLPHRLVPRRRLPERLLLAGRQRPLRRG